MLALVFKSRILVGHVNKFSNWGHLDVAFLRQKSKEGNEHCSATYTHGEQYLIMQVPIKIKGMWEKGVIGRKRKGSPKRDIEEFRSCFSSKTRWRVHCLFSHFFLFGRTHLVVFSGR